MPDRATSLGDRDAGCRPMHTGDRPQDQHRQYHRANRQPTRGAACALRADRLVERLLGFADARPRRQVDGLSESWSTSGGINARTLREATVISAPPSNGRQPTGVTMRRRTRSQRFA
jgi:hypothetical protein